jgi:hypothetical protein
MQANGVYYGMLVGNIATAIVGHLWISSVIKRLENGALKAVAVES